MTKIEDFQLLITFDFWNRHFGEALELHSQLENTPINRQTLFPIIRRHAIIDFVALLHLAVLAPSFVILLGGLNVFGLNISVIITAWYPSLLITKSVFEISIDHLSSSKCLYFGNFILWIVFIKLLELAIRNLLLRLVMILLSFENLRSRSVHPPRVICISISRVQTDTSFSSSRICSRVVNQIDMFIDIRVESARALNCFYIKQPAILWMLWWSRCQIRRFSLCYCRLINLNFLFLFRIFFLIAKLIIIIFSRPTGRRFRPIWTIRIGLWVIRISQNNILEIFELSLTSILIIFQCTLSDSAILFEAFSRWVKWFWHRLRSLHHLKLNGSGRIHIIRSFCRFLRSWCWARLKTSLFINLSLLWSIMFESSKWPTLIFWMNNIILNSANRISLHAEGHVLSRIVLRWYLTWSLIFL